MSIVYVGIDLAKNLFAVHGVNQAGKPELVRSAVRRDQLVELVASLTPCTIAMEACSGAHHWARLFVQFGHTVKLIAPKFVTPFRMTGRRSKNDAADAAAICEAVQRPNMRFVPVKSIDQQQVLSVHRVRQGLVETRTATINRLRGILAEFGVVLPQKASTVRLQTAARLDELPMMIRALALEMLAEVAHLDERIAAYTARIGRLIGGPLSPTRRLMQHCGVAEMTASVIVAMIGNGHDFKCGRQFAAWEGPAPLLQ